MKTINNQGFTLIEIMVAATIFSFAVLGLAIGTVSVIQTNQNSHLQASAINLAQAKLEELRAMTSAAFSSLSCPNLTTIGCSDSPVASGTTFNRSWQITANLPVTGVNQIDVQITWRDYTNRSVTFTASVPQ
ncbi:MAG: type IV pilus modification PilV family protein [Alphaproteobacteria bacterium]